MRRAGLTPDAWQLDLIANRKPQHLICCSRQVGKSTTTAAIALEVALSKPEQLVLLVSRSLRQSSELFRKVRVYFNASRPMALVRDSQLSMELENGSRIISLPGVEGTIVGYSAAALVIIDEAARTLDGLFYGLRPMLAVSRGHFLALSSPFGKRGWFYQMWAEGGESWGRTHVTAYQSSLIDPAWLEEERGLVPERIFRREWEAEFLDDEGAVFRYDDLVSMLSDDLQPLWGGEVPADPYLSTEVQPLFKPEAA